MFVKQLVYVHDSDIKKQFPKRIENRYSEKGLHPDVHRSIIHRCQDMEET